MFCLPPPHQTLESWVVEKRDARREAERKEAAEGGGLMRAVMWEKTQDEWKLLLC